MEIGSIEHRQLLKRSIWKTAIKTGGIGSIIGLALMAPSLLRDNTFSQVLLYIGCFILGFSIVYAIGIAQKKLKTIEASLKKL